MRRGAIKSTLAGFLGTYVSRGTDHQGYLLFGFLVAGFRAAHIDLCTEPSGPPGAWTAAAEAAHRKFWDQATRNGVPWDQIASASLHIQGGAVQERRVDRVLRPGRVLVFSASARLRDGRAYTRTAQAFIAEHAPLLERQSRWPRGSPGGRG